MRFKYIYKLRMTCGINVLTASSGKLQDMKKVINLNDTAVAIYQAFQAKEFDENDVADLLVSKYGIDKNTALEDSHTFCENLRSEGVVE